MRCDEVRRFAPFYLDGEFDDSEAARFQEHMEGCESCRREVRALRSFGEAFRARMNPPSMPTEVRRRIELAVLTSQGSGSRRWWLLAGSGGAAAILVAVVTWWAVGGSQGESAGRPFVELAQEAVLEHQAEIPMEVEGDETAVRSFLANKAPEQPPAPLAESKDTQLIGVRLTRVGANPAVLYKYRHQNRPLSVVQVRQHALGRYTPDRLPEVGPIRVVYDGTQGGYNVTLFEGRGYTHTVVSDMPNAEVRKLIPASL